MVVAVKKQALNLLPKMHLLEFDLPEGLLESLPKFTIQTYSIRTEAVVERKRPLMSCFSLKFASNETLCRDGAIKGVDFCELKLHDRALGWVELLI